MPLFSPKFSRSPNNPYAILFPSTLLPNIRSIPTMSLSSSSPSTLPHQQDSNEAQVLKYHNQTKHSFTNYARGPRGLDWANQPKPFRRFDSAPLVPLLHPPPPNQTPPPYSSVFLNLPPPKPISKSAISQLFFDSLAISAWKTTGFSTWSLRVNPSSGNLHPTESYIIAPAIESVSDSAFVAHYAPKEHSLEVRAEISSGFLPKFFPKGSFLIGFSSIFWREAWKYGERAFRYCNHDVGHAIAAVSMAAAELGWDVKVLDGLGYEDLKKLMGLEIFPEFEIPARPVKGKFPVIEFEHPDCVLVVFPNGVVSEVVRKRRSAVDMDGVHVMQIDTFYQILLHCLPSGSQNGGKQGRQLGLPFRVLSWDSEVHAVLFVHKVAGLPSGLYFLVRNEDHFDDLKKATRSNFKWAKPEGCPDDLPLYELTRGDFQELAKRISCHQDIAGDGCFSLGMVAHFEGTLQNKSAWMYPRLFWETGVLGQVLYLEAHAVGISATGIGCYFDDAVHELLGLRGSSFQSLYHFTVGGPVLDKRIMSLPAYPGPAVDS
ncbi:hypothetical protein CK203_051582 [Vitis vinifera]|uniref:Nitroreductase domain-containing protein n=1 Tax=Vitis vinifera TaxID=29760 RepID=A0A438GXH6_VITVI|nr:hypothetical protein CK203_051582 [Vitis vinifera]